MLGIKTQEMSNKLLDALQFSFMLMGQSEQGGTSKWITNLCNSLCYNGANF